MFRRILCWLGLGRRLLLTGKDGWGVAPLKIGLRKGGLALVEMREVEPGVFIAHWHIVEDE